MTGQADDSGSVQATLEYVSPDSKVNLRYVGDGKELNTGVFEQRRVRVRDARRSHEPLNLQTCGFELARHVSEVDFYDDAKAEAAYAREIEPLLLRLTGADRVVLFGSRRRHLTQSGGEVLPAASDVHVDYAAPDARAIAQSLLGDEGGDGMPYRRFMAVNIWRALTPPPQDRPLAVCDARSVVSQSGALNGLMLVDSMPSPEEILTQQPELPPSRNGFLFHFDPAHRWYHYPDMAADEVLLFKLYDSIETGPWHCPHVSFADPSVTGAQPRESYEIRSFVYFR